MLDGKPGYIHYNMLTANYRSIALDKELVSKTTVEVEMNIWFYYSTIMSFHRVRSRDCANYKTIIHCSIPV